MSDSETGKTPTLQLRLSAMEEQLQVLIKRSEELANSLNLVVALVQALQQYNGRQSAELTALRSQLISLQRLAGETSTAPLTRAS